MPDLNLVELIDIITHYIGELETEFIKDVEARGITLKQAQYLGVVSRLGHPSLGELADELDLSKPSVTAIVDKLASAGYLERVKSDADRRSAHVHLTPEGGDIVSMHDEVHRKIASFFEQTLESGDLKKLVSILNKSVAVLVKE